MYMNAEYDGLSFPINVMVNGWMVKLINIQANSATAYGDSVAIKLNPAPSSGGRQDFVFLEVWTDEILASAPVFWLYGSGQYLNAETAPVLNTNYTTDSLDPRVSYTVTRLPNGNWLQVRHRFRIVDDINPVDDSTGFGGTNAYSVMGRGASAAPVSGYAFSNMLATKGDGGLWRAGSGNAQSKTDLSTYDGYTYAVPVAMVHRRNTGQFNLNNQNGTKKADNSGGSITEGTPSLVMSGRPDNLHYDEVAPGDYIDMRHWVDFYGVDFERLRERAMTEVLRGTSRLQWNQLAYSTSLDVWGNSLLTNDTIFNSGVYNPITDPDLGSNTNYVIDKSVGSAAYSEPDGIRKVYAASETEQSFEFWVDPFGSPSSAYATSHPTFITVSSNVDERTVTIDTSALEASTNATVSAAPVIWYWSVDRSAISVSVGGTATARTFTFDTTGHPAEKVLATVALKFPHLSGLSKLPSKVVRQDYYDPISASTLTSYSTIPYSPEHAHHPVQITEGADGYIWVAEYSAGAISWWSESPSGLVKVGYLSYLNASSNFTGVWANEGYNNPYGVAVYGTPLTGAGGVWVNDYHNRRIRKYTYNPGTSKWSLVTTISSFTESGSARQIGSAGGGAYDLAVTSDGATLYIADPFNAVVWKFATATPTVATAIAGVYNVPGNSTALGALKLNWPVGLNIDHIDGHLWIVDHNNQRVIKVNSSTGALIIGVNNGGTSVGSVPTQINSSDTVLIVGNPQSSPSTVKYLVRGNDRSGAAKSERIYVLDADFNVERISPAYYRSYDFTVDNQVTPTYVFVSRSHSADVGISTAVEKWGVEVLSYSTLTKVAETDTAASNTIGVTAGVQWVSGNYGIPAAPAGYTVTLTGALFAFGNAAYTGGPKAPFRLYLVTNNTTGAKELRIIDNYNSGHSVVNGTDTDPAYYMTQFTKMVSLGGVPTMWQTTGYFNGISPISKAWKWTWVSGNNRWERTAQAAPAITMNGVFVWGADQDTTGNLYVADMLGNYIYRYKKNGGSMDAPGTAGNTPGSFGTGVAGPTKTQIAAPRSISVSADDSRIVVICNKSLGYFEEAAIIPQPINRVIFLAQTTTKWESGAETPYLSDTLNNGSVIVAIATPRGVIRKNDSVYITSFYKNTVHKLTAAVTGDLTTLQEVGVFGAPYESRTDHGGLYNPSSVVALGTTPNTERLVIADFSASRLIRIYTKMAGVSKSSGNVQTMVPLASNERLRMWYEAYTYQGVGSNFLSGNGIEYVWNTQIVVSPSTMISTTLGRAPITGPFYSDYGGCIDRLPLGAKTLNAPGGSSDFAAGNIITSGNIVELSPFMELPLLTKKDMCSPQEIAMRIRMDLGAVGYIHKGFTAELEVVPSQYSTFKYDPSCPSRVNAISMLVKRAGKLYLVIVTQPTAAGYQSNPVGTSYPYVAADFFEVPGRLLVK
jgi:hypothetical protein